MIIKNPQSEEQELSCISVSLNWVKVHPWQSLWTNVCAHYMSLLPWRRGIPPYTPVSFWGTCLQQVPPQINLSLDVQPWLLVRTGTPPPKRDPECPPSSWTGNFPASRPCSEDTSTGVSINGSEDKSRPNLPKAPTHPAAAVRVAVG